jgi:hypothetical protein
VVAPVRWVPAARLADDAAGAAGFDDAVGAGADARGDGELVEAAGRVGRLGVFAAGAGALSVGRSFNSAVVSTGASWRSRLRLSAAAVSLLSPRPHPAIAAKVSAAINVLDI